MDVELNAGQIVNPADAARFVYGGNALFTIVSKKTGRRFTFKVMRAHNDRESTLRFVKVLSGPDNTTSYMYIGYLNTKNPGAMLPGKKGSPNADSYRALAWAVGNMSAGRMPEELEFYHSGRCGCCGRTLTVPESIETGFGPVCAGKHK